MIVITIICQARCKHCKFAKTYRPKKKDGNPSRRLKTRCENPVSPRSGLDISQRDLVCDKWELT